MTNEELAIKIHEGQKEYIDPLWSNVENFIKYKANRFHHLYETRCQQVGAEIEDLVQVGFFALMKAVDAYKSGYAFLTYLGYYLKNEFRALAKMRYLGWQNNTIYQAVSLDNMINEDTCFIDMLADPDADRFVSEIVEEEYQSQLKKALADVFPLLTDRQREVIDGLYYRGLTYRELAQELDVQPSSLNNSRIGAFNKLRNHEPLRALMYS